MSQIGSFFPGGGGGGSPIETITGNTGGPVGPDGAFNINLLGAGAVTVAGNPGTNTETISIAGGGLVWQVITADQTASVNHGYICNKAGTLALLLPATSVIGDILRVTGMNTDLGWQITQGAGQVIHLGTSTTTVGAGGSLGSTKTYDTIELVCNIANLSWIAFPPQGNITVV